MRIACAFVRAAEARVLPETSAAVRDAAFSISPSVEVRERVYADLASVIGFHGGERQAAQAFQEALRRGGLEASVGVAGTRLAAFLAANAQNERAITLVPPAGERRFLAPCPIAAGGPPPELLETLRRWGLHTLGQLAALPREGVGARLGGEGVRWHRLACGEEIEPWQPVGAAMELSERVELEWGVDRLEPLLFALQQPLERLVSGLTERGLACSRLTLKLDLEPRGTAWRSVEPAAPTRDARALAAFVRYALEKEPAGASVTGVLLGASSARPRFEQHRLFGRPSVPPEKLWTTLARLEALSGDAKLGSPEPVDGFLSGDDGARLVRFEPPPAPLEAPPPAAHAPLAALRLFRPPRAAEVLIERDRPAAVSADGVRGRVVDCAGPWKVTARWWSTARALDGYDVSLSDGGTYRLAFDRIEGRWLVEGEYD
ncbi:MAG TPA: DNA polymerase Y family protein [Myxococcales bacterium]|nr:DNA polymerase Y family protein [Myxococcales bacterium]